MRKTAYHLNYLHEQSHWWFLARREILSNVLHGLKDQGLLPEAPFEILDYGCGTGGLTQTLSPFGNVSAVDAHDEALAYCHQRGLSQARKITSPKELPDNAYHLLTSFDVLEHVEDEANLLNHWQRMLKPGGVLLITVPAYNFLWGGEDEISGHFRRYTRYELKRSVEAAGFDVVRASYFNTVLFPLIAMVRLGNRIFRPSIKEQSDVADTPRLLSGVLCRLFALERYLLRWMNLPFGVSILLIAKKPTTDARQS